MTSHPLMCLTVARCYGYLRSSFNSLPVNGLSPVPSGNGLSIIFYWHKEGGSGDFRYGLIRYTFIGISISYLALEQYLLSISPQYISSVWAVTEAAYQGPGQK